MTDMTNMAAPPATSEPPPEDEPKQGGICIEIKCKADGTFEVSSEPLEEETQEAEMPAEPGAAEPAGETVQSFPEALKAAIRLYQDSAATTDQAQMSAGYNNG